jgi:dipeptidyl aminopeptidase/acylaminoacyl peptidase
MLFRLALLFLSASTTFAQGTKADYDRAASLTKRTDGKVFRAKVVPHWLPGGDSFWYRVEIGQGKFENVFVDCVKGERRAGYEVPADAAKPAALGEPHPSGASDVESSITFINKTAGSVVCWWIDMAGKPRRYATVKPGERIRQHTFAGHVWVVENEARERLGVFEAHEGGGEAVIEGSRKAAKPESAEKGGEVSNQKPEPRAANQPGAQAGQGRNQKSPWRGFIRDHNIWVKHRDTGEEVQLSRDGVKDDAYREPVLISPDGRHAVVMQVQPEQEHPVHFIESSPKDQVQPKLHTHQYLKPGDRIRRERPRLFDLEKRESVAADDSLFKNPWSISDLRWQPDSSEFTFLFNQRGHRVLRVVAVDAETGAARTLIEEKSETFVDYSQKTWFRWLDATGELLWMSERDGWNHIYLCSRRRQEAGALETGERSSEGGKNPQGGIPLSGFRSPVSALSVSPPPAVGGYDMKPITRGPWVVRGVERVDEEKRQLWLRVAGIKPGQDPYFVHFARVNFDGSGFTLLTEGDGTHAGRRSGEGSGFALSTNGCWLLDTYSRVDMPPVTELRNAETGRLVCILEKAEATELTAAGWTVPERFVAKGRDGTTDIFGIIIKPSNFDPAKKYPVVEEIYAGPHGYFVPKEWGRESRQHAIAELGFIVVQIDGMGTNWRGKAFHDVAWRNLKDAGFPDRIAWMKSAASTRPWMDLTRVGIYGGSAGGQNALAGLLHHGDFYKVGVADCGCHDNRMDKIWWNEAWLGEAGPWYAENSNVTHAAKLTGKLMLIFGEMDRNVDPASTMQVVNALEKANKDFDLVVMTGSDHGSAESAYGSRRRADFLVRHLLGVEPRAR